MKLQQPSLTIIDHLEGILALKLYLASKDVIAYDTETTGVHMGAEIIGCSFCAEKDKAFYIITAVWDVTSQSLITMPYGEAVKDLVASLKSKSLIMHNAVFDCMITEAFYKISLIEDVHTDTMVLAHLLDENRRIGLKELGKTVLGIDADKEAKEMKASVLANGGKLTKDCYEMYKADAYLMGKYGAKDAWMTYMLFQVLVLELLDQDLTQFFYEDECMPLLKGPTYELNTVGLKVDLQKLTALKKQLEAECAEAKDFIYREIAPHIKDKYPGTTKKNVFNMGSNNQLAWLLFGKLELEFNKLTKGGKIIARHVMNKVPYTASDKRNFIHECVSSAGEVYAPAAIVNGKKKNAKKLREPWNYIAVDKGTLQKYAAKFKWVERLLEHNKKIKLLNTYVSSIEQRTKYGIIRPSFLQTGTSSGRYACRSPNFQNLPRDDKRVKACIVARPGKCFVEADQSQLEPRVFAYYSNDKALLEAFAGADDFYSVIGMRVYKLYDCVARKEGSPDAFGVKYKPYRDLSKVIALASTYGATAHQLAPTTRKSVDDTQQDIDDYFEAFPGVKDMMLEAHNLAKTQGFVTNLFGRKRRMPEALLINKHYGNAEHGELPYEARNLLNLAVNFRIQATGASIINRGAIAFNRNCKVAGIDCKMVLQVHDSIVIECNEADAEAVSLLLRDAMENTVRLEGIKFEAIPKISKSLAG